MGQTHVLLNPSTNIDENDRESTETQEITYGKCDVRYTQLGPLLKILPNLQDSHKVYGSLL